MQILIILILSSRGTGPLDNGKIYLLIDAAEMMRDYSGWTRQDQRFKDMLVYPGIVIRKIILLNMLIIWMIQKWSNFYWNIYNFDAAFPGNQGLFAARSIRQWLSILIMNNVLDHCLSLFTGNETS